MVTFGGIFLLTRKVLGLCVVFLICSSTVGSISKSIGMPNPLNNMKSYKVFYDEPTKQIINQMAAYDVVIVEPLYYTKELVKEIQAKGVQLYAYVSVMESDSWNKNRMSKIKKEDYYYKNGKEVYFEEWDSYLMNLTSKHYQNVLFEEIEQQGIDKGFNGIFLDTVGDIDDQFYYTNKAEYKKQAKSFVLLMERVIKKHGDISFIQNWGINLFRDYTHIYMDGMMWEDFEPRNISNDDWAKDRLKDLKTLQKKQDFKVLTLSFSDGSRSKKLSSRYGFVHYHEAKSFNEW